MSAEDTKSRREGFARTVWTLLTRLFSVEALTHFYAWITGVSNIVLPKARDPFDDHRTIHRWHDRIAGELTPGLSRELAEHLMLSWGFEFNHYRHDELGVLIHEGRLDAPPANVTGVLLAGRVIGEPGSVQPHLRILIYLESDERVDRVRTEIIHV